MSANGKQEPEELVYVALRMPESLHDALKAKAREDDRSLAATDRAAEVLGFRAAIELEEGLRRTAAWLAGQP